VSSGVLDAAHGLKLLLPSALCQQWRWPSAALLAAGPAGCPGIWGEDGELQLDPAQLAEYRRLTREADVKSSKLLQDRVALEAQLKVLHCIQSAECGPSIASQIVWGTFVCPSVVICKTEVAASGHALDSATAVLLFDAACSKSARVV